MVRVAGGGSWREAGLALGIVACLTGCGGTKGPRPIDDFGQRFTVTGASVQPPHGPQWYRGRRDAVYVEFAKDLGRQGLHTVKASLWSETIAAPITTGDELTRFVEESTRSDFANPRYTITSLQVRPESDLGALCDRLHFVVEDRGTQGPVVAVFVVSGWEVFCVHPRSGGRVLVRVGASQRVLSPSRPLDLDAETEPMRRSLRFERLA